jgi:hypothetical protein
MPRSGFLSARALLGPPVRYADAERRLLHVVKLPPPSAYHRLTCVQRLAVAVISYAQL